MEGNHVQSSLARIQFLSYPDNAITTLTIFQVGNLHSRDNPMAEVSFGDLISTGEGTPYSKIEQSFVDTTHP